MSQITKSSQPPDRMVYATATDILPGGRAAADPEDWSLLSVGPGLAHLTGWENGQSLSQAAGGTLWGLFCPEDRAGVRADLNQLLSVVGKARVECRLIRKCGTPVWATLCAGLVRSGTDGVCLECFFLDLTDLHRAEADLAERCRTLSEQMRREVMTGLLNREAFKEDVRAYLKGAAPEAEYALLVVDLDDFKCVNDRWGHTFGDRVLLAFSAALVESFGAEALCGRYGGDEFVVFLKNTSVSAVGPALKAFYRNLRCRRKGDLFFHCSVGAVCGKGMLGYSLLFDRADTALYQAKRMGKNRFVISRI